jgi:nucleoside 2-deoxyribosyltransferase
MNKKIYFAGSIRGGRDDQELYNKFIQYLTKYGQVLTEHVGDKKITTIGEDGPNDQKIYERDMSWMKEADLIIAEVSTPSLGVGYEIGKAENLGKKILCLYRDNPNKRLSAMINGNPNLKTIKYKTLEEAQKHLDDFFNNYSK